MGPRSFKRGNQERRQRKEIAAHASMGPRSFKRGNMAKVYDEVTGDYGFNGATLFQAWKHEDLNSIRTTKPALQWGHALSRVETGIDWVEVQYGEGASMGPRSFKRGNKSNTASGRAETSLQWGHALSSVETHARTTCCRRSNPGFNGATLFQAWKR